jgi:hypothetical protein
MLIPCNSCTNGTTSAGTQCYVCGGDGEINLIDANFKFVSDRALRPLRGVVWGDILTRLASIEAKTDNLPANTSSKLDDIEAKVNDVMDKCNGHQRKT